MDKQIDEQMGEDIDDLDSTWIQEFEKLDKDYKNYYTENISFLRVRSIYINKQNEIEKVIEELEAGTIPKGICKSINSLIKPEMLQNPIKIISVLRNSIPKEFLENIPNVKSVGKKEDREVILSEYFAKT